MHVIRAQNVNEAFHEGLWVMDIMGVEEPSRNGAVKVLPTPMTTIYERPWEKVLFHKARRANPFFHLLEAMWMLAGRSDVAFVAKYNARMREFADEGILRGAYGYRWRNHWADQGGEPLDQILMVIAMLRRDPTTRRAVINMWCPYEDLDSENRDIPCNTQIYFRCVEGRLDMTLTCRSNDIVWGAYGANAVHFGFLHELVAQGIGVEQGRMYQISNNWHMYERHWHLMSKKEYDGCPYVLHDHPYVPLVGKGETVEDIYTDAKVLTSGELGYEAAFSTHFFKHVVKPMAEAWAEHRKDNDEMALRILNDTYPCDWADAGILWIKEKP